MSSFDGILPHVEKPSRYIDSELNLSSAGYAEGGFNVLLVFPDAYEIGMSHQGIRLLYERLSRMEGVGVELAFAPWPDMEELMRSVGEPLRSWQSRTPAKLFDCIGFSITYELHHTNMMTVLDLAGLAPEASRRGEADPVVIAGGPGCSNPLPFVEALDAVFLGDAEDSLTEAVLAMRGVRGSGGGRGAMREALAGVDGVFVDGITPSARYRVHRFEETELSRAPIVPSAAIVHDRLAVEIMRGCTRGCRFCHAGIIYRPRRERRVGEIVDAVRAGLDASGWEEVSLLSLSSSDYPCLDELLERLVPELERRRVSLAMPSLRPETVTDGIVTAASLQRRSGFTLAPEAGTERLRRVINKGMSDEEILAGCRKIVEGGWQNLKLYFMIGLPTETEEDLDGIVTLVERILGLPGGRFKLAVSVSPFVPKPHTPFQWERQCSIDEITGKEAYLAARMKGRRVQLSMRDPAVSLLEGIIARGDRALWPVLREAYRLGCRFDGWRNMIRFDLWRRAFAANGLDIDGLTAGFSPDADLPWKPFVPVVKTAYLRRERERALAGQLTPDCRGGKCSGCGACDGEAGEVAAIALSDRASAAADRGEGECADGQPVRYRFVFTKVGRERFLSHLETISVVQRALRRSGLPLVFTRGFHPHPRLSMGPSLAVGIAGLREFFDAELSFPVEVAREDFDVLLPPGMRIMGVGGPFTRGVGKLPPEARYTYTIGFDEVAEALAPGGGEHKQLFGESEVWYRLLEALLPAGREEIAAKGFTRDPAGWVRGRLDEFFRSGGTVKDRRGRIRGSGGCAVGSGGAGTVTLSVPADRDGALRPKDILAAVLHPVLAEMLRYTRITIEYRRGDGYLDPIALIKEKQHG